MRLARGLQRSMPLGTSPATTTIHGAYDTAHSSVEEGAGAGHVATPPFNQSKDSIRRAPGAEAAAWDKHRGAFVGAAADRRGWHAQRFVYRTAHHSTALASVD